jgi:ribose transport system permease protein
LVKSQGLVAMLLALIVTFSVLNNNFFTSGNALNMAGTNAALGIMAVAQTFLIISGGFDVSVGSVIAMTTVIIGLGVDAGHNVWASAVVALLVAGLIGAVNGVIVVWLEVNPLIATLGTLSIFSGLAFVLSNGQTLVVADAGFLQLGFGSYAGLPIPVVAFLVVFAAAVFVERMLTVGRSIYAVGGNREAARLAGIRVSLVPFVLYVMSALSAGLAGVLITAQLAAASPQVGQSYLLSVVTAVILGGASLSGGRGSVLGTLVAVVILGVLQNGFALLSISSYLQTVALGAALIVAVLIDKATRAIGK